jgi:hypothetical protein
MDGGCYIGSQGHRIASAEGMGIPAAIHLIVPLWQRCLRRVSVSALDVYIGLEVDTGHYTVITGRIGQDAMSRRLY